MARTYNLKEKPMYSNNKEIRDVADVAARIMAGLPPLEEKLHPNQQKLDVHEPEKDELTSDDFKKLRAGKKPDVKKEEVEELDEVKMADLPSTKVQGRSYGSSKPQPSAFDVLKGPKEKELKSIESEKKKKKMSEMVALYKEGGMKAFFESIKKEDLIAEEPDSEQFAKELEDQKKRAAGTKPQVDVAKPSVQSVKQEEVEIQVINADLANGVDQVDIEERVMTEPEKEKKEEMVKSMKKGLAGFKERYGDRAKNVMYATATKNAMKD
jgi:hypothetical protein